MPQNIKQQILIANQAGKVNTKTGLLLSVKSGRPSLITNKLMSILYY